MCICVCEEEHTRRDSDVLSICSPQRYLLMRRKKHTEEEEEEDEGRKKTAYTNCIINISGHRKLSSYWTGVCEACKQKSYKAISLSLALSSSRTTAMWHLRQMHNKNKNENKNENINSCTFVIHISMYEFAIFLFTVHVEIQRRKIMMTPWYAER